MRYRRLFPNEGSEPTPAQAAARRAVTEKRCKVCGHGESWHAGRRAGCNFPDCDCARAEPFTHCSVCGRAVFQRGARGAGGSNHSTSCRRAGEPADAYKDDD